MRMPVQENVAQFDRNGTPRVGIGAKVLSLSLSGAVLWSALLIFYALLHFLGGTASIFFLVYWVMALFVPGIMYLGGKGRALRSLPIGRCETGTLLWVLTVWAMPVLALPSPLALGSIRATGPGDALFFSALMFTLSSSATLFLAATHFRVTGSAWITSDVFELRSPAFLRRQRKPWLLLGLGVLPLVVLLVHPAWRVAQGDWVHYALIGAAVFSLVPSFRMRACLWGDFMNASSGKVESHAPHADEIVFLPRWRTRLFELHRGAFSRFVCGTIGILPFSVISWQMGATHSRSTDWRALIWMVFIVLPWVFREQWDAIRAYRMLPLSGIGLWLRLLYRIAVSFAFLLAPMIGLVLFQSGGVLVDIACLAVLGLGLTLVAGAAMAVWSRDLAAIPAVLMGVFSSSHWMLSEARTAVAAAGLFLVVVGSGLCYIALTRSDRAYRPRSRPGTGEVRL